MRLGPVFVTVLPARTAKPSAVPSGTAAACAVVASDAPASSAANSAPAARRGRSREPRDVPAVPRTDRRSP